MKYLDLNPPSPLRYCLKYNLNKEKGVAAMAALGERVHVALGDGLGRILLVQATSGEGEKQPRLVASRVHWHSLPVTSLRHDFRQRHFIFTELYYWQPELLLLMAQVWWDKL